jgi:hypothetical protein
MCVSFSQPQHAILANLITITQLFAGDAGEERRLQFHLSPRPIIKPSEHAPSRMNFHRALSTSKKQILIKVQRRMLAAQTGLLPLLLVILEKTIHDFYLNKIQSTPYLVVAS